ncbi:hypothetical protein L6164_032576 [Bauhinia variegata]|uniref:Uncharacterized protein n=1 Tax=Bauhinia variegata TaxID=167791 RepID=A0ACB9KP90_BAUVA|nr:hypothetical protein L6164_032576 [Bauhinia variegata]
MSLAPLQGYSSVEEDEQEALDNGTQYSNSDDDEDGGGKDEPPAVAHPSLGDRSLFDLPQPSSTSGLPSAFDAFSENSFDKEDRKLMIVVEAKARLVGIHERVRSDLKSSQPPNSATSSTSEGGKRIATATNPNAEDSAELLRMCLHWGFLRHSRMHEEWYALYAGIGLRRIPA